MRIAVLNGPNLNLLGRREPSIYGTTTLAEIEHLVRERATARGADIDWFQTNGEGDFITHVQDVGSTVDGFVVNAAAFTHTSVAIRDALLAVNKPFVEAHLSNIFAREQQRRHSMLADIAVGVVTGFGATSYLLAIDGLLAYLETT